VVIIQLPFVYFEHIILNFCKAGTEMWLQCSYHLFLLCLLYRTGAKQELTCGYTAAAFCLYLE